MGNKKVFLYIAGGCFAVVALFELLKAVTSYFFSFTDIIGPISYMLVAVGLFLGQTTISTIGSGVLTIYTLYDIVKTNRILGELPTDYIVYTIILAASCALLILTVLLKNSSMITGILSATARVICLITTIVWQGRITVSNIVPAILFAVGVILIGLSRNAKELRDATKNIAPEKTKATNNIEKITKLKGLLDSGAITQEEYDAKKKQLLGL